MPGATSPNGIPADEKPPQGNEAKLSSSIENPIFEPGLARDQEQLGLPSALVEGWFERMPDILERMVSGNPSVEYALDVCVHCQVCASACPIYLATNHPGDTPVARTQLAGQLIRRAGSLFSRVRSIRPSPADLEEWFNEFHRCLSCRRCAVACPLGVDHSEVSLACRRVMAELGLTARHVSGPTADIAAFGNSLGASPADWVDRCSELERLVFDETGVAVRFPVDIQDTEVMLLVPAADAFHHPGDMIGYAKMLHVAGVSWTTCSWFSEADNPGCLLSLDVMQRLNREALEAARDLGSKRIVWGESGLGWRVARNFTDILNGPLEKTGFLKQGPVHICEYTWELFQKGIFDGKLDPAANRDWSVSYHDPCQAARSANLSDAPRGLIKASVADFREMPEHTVGRWTHCCGGGGGMMQARARELRMAMMGPRAEAFKQTGAEVMVTSCDICKAALAEGLAVHMDRETRVVGVMELFGRALTPYLRSIGLPDG